MNLVFSYINIDQRQSQFHFTLKNHAALELIILLVVYLFAQKRGLETMLYNKWLRKVKRCGILVTLCVFDGQPCRRKFFLFLFCYFLWKANTGKMSANIQVLHFLAPWRKILSNKAISIWWKSWLLAGQTAPDNCLSVLSLSVLGVSCSSWRTMQSFPSSSHSFQSLPPQFPPLPLFLQDNFIEI